MSGRSGIDVGCILFTKFYNLYTIQKYEMMRKWS